MLAPNLGVSDVLDLMKGDRALTDVGSTKGDLLL